MGCLLVVDLEGGRLGGHGVGVEEGGEEVGGVLVLAGCWDGGVRVYETSGVDMRRRWCVKHGGGGGVCDMAVVGGNLVVAGRDGSITWWE